MIIARLFLPLSLLALSGCASTQSYHNPQDPLEPLNRGIYQFNEVVDKAVVTPAAKGYNAIMPTAGRVMVHNFFSNLDDVIVTLNELLQFKLVSAFSDSGRLLINSTVGVFGLVDVATTVGYPKHREDFGQTLGVWGVENGPYLVVPFLGPSTLRDSIGDLVDSKPSRISRISHMRTRNQVYALKAVNRRSELLTQEKVLDQAVLDRYSFIRDAYLLRRQSMVYDGNPPRIKYDDEDYDEEDDSSPPASTPAPDSKAAPDHSSSIDTAPAVQPVLFTQPAAAAATEPQPSAVHRIWLAPN
ncbi:MAG: VacJ family lipoprotein [Sideroxydans sp.]|nr:VacJ family lipoprotein [Sideroxydans sp.]